MKCNLLRWAEPDLSLGEFICPKCGRKAIIDKEAEKYGFPKYIHDIYDLILGMEKDSIVREQLAEYAHDAWSGWMKYLFEKCDFKLDGTCIIPM